MAERKCEDVLSADVLGDRPLESIRLRPRLANAHDGVKLGRGISASLEGYAHGNERIRGPHLVQVLLDAADQLVDHARNHVATALSQNQPRTAVRAEEIDRLEQAEPAVAADGERNLRVDAESDRELRPNSVLEPAHDLFPELVSAACRDRGPVANFQDLRTEVALSPTFHPDERDDSVAALQESLEHAERAIRPAD